MTEGSLAARRVEDGYEIRHGAQVVGLLGDPKFEAVVHCSIRNSKWTFTRLRNGDTEAATGTAPIARYKSGFLPGGTIELPDGSRFRLRPPVIGESWRLRHGRRKAVLAIGPAPRGWDVRFKPGAQDVNQLPLLALFALHAVLVEVDRPTGDTGPAVPSG